MFSPTRDRLPAALAGAVVVLVALVVALIALIPGRGRPWHPEVSPAAFKGLGSWVDLYDGPAWQDPAATVARLHSHGVRTLFLETTNYRSDSDLAHPGAVTSFLAAAHARDMRVVAWTLPSLQNEGADLRRALAAVRFRDREQSFDGFALDIEPGQVTDPRRLTTSALRLSRDLRAAVGGDYALGAIIPSPVALARRGSLWDSFPYRRLASYYGVLLPMGYYGFTSSGPRGAARYTASSLLLLRRGAGDVPVHAIGGLAEDSDPAEVRAFVRAAEDQHVIGYSLYDAVTTSEAEWKALRR